MMRYPDRNQISPDGFQYPAPPEVNPTMTDQNQAVAALAEAMFGKKAGPTYCYYAEQAINAIAADPSLAGFKTVTVSELFATTPNDPDLPRDTANMWAPILIVPDPEPPAPELPSVLSDIDALYRRAVAREMYIQQGYRKGSDAWDECDRNLSGLKDIRQRLVDRAANGGFDAAAESGRSS